MLTVRITSIVMAGEGLPSTPLTAAVDVDRWDHLHRHGRRRPAIHAFDTNWLMNTG
jgi:hypothetical protein